MEVMDGSLRRRTLRLEWYLDAGDMRAFGGWALLDVESWLRCFWARVCCGEDVRDNDMAATVSSTVVSCLPSPTLSDNM
jgi:hypothetical protein